MVIILLLLLVNVTGLSEEATPSLVLLGTAKGKNSLTLTSCQLTSST